MSKKMVYLKVWLNVEVNDDEKTETMLENMDYQFTSFTEGAVIEDAEITSWEITDEEE